MSRFTDLRPANYLTCPENNAKHASECLSLTEYPNAVRTPPLKLDVDIAENDRFTQFLDFVDRAISQKRDNEMSADVQKELRKWFPFVSDSMTVFLNVDVHVRVEQKEDVRVLEKPQSVKKIKFPEPAPRSLPEVEPPAPKSELEPEPEPVIEPIVVLPPVVVAPPPEPVKSLFIPALKPRLDVQQIAPWEATSDKRNTPIAMDIGLDNLFLSNLLKKRSDAPQIARTSTQRPLRLDDLNERLISNHIVKVRSFWDGSYASYPHSFKKLCVMITENSNEICAEETIDHSKKVIPTMGSEHMSEMWDKGQDN